MRIGCTKAYYLFAFIFVSGSRCLPYRGKLTEGLHLNEVRINTTLVEKLLMCTLLGYATLVYNIDAVGIIDGAQAVGDDDGCTTLKKLCKGILNELLALGVES